MTKQAATLQVKKSEAQHNTSSPLQVGTSEDFLQRGTAELLESVWDKMLTLNSFHTFREEMCQVLHETIGIFLKASYLYKIGNPLNLWHK